MKCRDCFMIADGCRSCDKETMFDDVQPFHKKMRKSESNISIAQPLLLLLNLLNQWFSDLVLTSSSDLSNHTAAAATHATLRHEGRGGEFQLENHALTIEYLK